MVIIMGDLIDFRTKQVIKKPSVLAKQCYEIRNNRVWCPEKQWYLSEGCPFSCKGECDNYAEMCGGVR